MIHRHRPIRVCHTLPFVLLLLTVGVPPVLAQEVWRLAGTFNGWNTRSDEWTMIEREAEPGVYTIVREMPSGRHRFKFVRNGDWSQGHLGMSADGGLEQPGDDLLLNLGAAVPMAITLDTNTNTWDMQTGPVDEPMIVARIMGQARVGRAFSIDLSGSLSSGGSDQRQFSLASPDQPLRIVQPDPSIMRALVTPTKPGPMTLEIELFDGEQRATATRSLDVVQPYTLTLIAADEPKSPVVHDLLWQGGEVYRAVLHFERETLLESLSIDHGEASLLTVRASNVPPGTYVVEVRDGAVVTQQDPRLPFCLLSGEWQEFSYRVPRSMAVTSVHVTGDFNQWALPGHPRVIELQPRADGTFSAVVDLPKGAHRYQFILNGDQLWIADPANPNRIEATEGPASSVLVIGPTPADFPEAVADHINREAVRHDPGQPRDFAPISASLGLADVSITTLPGDVSEAYLLLEQSTDDGGLDMLRIPMHRSPDLAGFDRFTARIMTGRRVAAYSFESIDGPANERSRLFRTTITPDESARAPDWALGAVWYQIFAERFRNGNPLNDPHGPDVFPMKWTANWYETQPGEEQAWRKRAGLSPDEPLDAKSGGELYHWVWDRRYGGDLQGVQEKLDDLKALGVTAIYLNPVFEADSMHKYDATDYRHIDDNFGNPRSAGRVPERWEPISSETMDPATWTWTEADRYFIDEFLPACRERGICVVIDGVFNHTGRRFWAFQDVIEHGIRSPYADWYYAEFDDEGKLESWTAWDGPSGWLPKFQQTENGDLVAPVKQHLMDITSRWMDPDGDGDPSDGIDGWRLDVPLDVGAPFWRDWRAHVKSINPDAIIIAEIWDEGDRWFLGNAFDTQMHYPFAMAVTEWLAVDPEMTSTQLAGRLEAAFDDAPQTNLIHQNLFGSHDTDRFVSMLFNPGRRYDQGNRIQDGDEAYRAGRPTREVYELSMVGAAIQATYLGAPMIYYGDEYGMFGADDPTDRKPLPWPDTGKNANRDDRPMPRMQRDYAEWFGLRHDAEIGPILRYGDVRHVETGDPAVFAFVRSLNGRRVLVVANRGSTPFDARGLVEGRTAGMRMPPRTARYWKLD